MEKEIIVVFQSARGGGVMTHLNGRVAFPSKRDPRAGEPKDGETWVVSIEGENPRGTVWFLRLVESPTDRAERQAKAEAERRAKVLARWEELRPGLEKFLRKHGVLAKDALERISGWNAQSLRHWNIESLECAIANIREDIEEKLAMADRWEKRIPAPHPGERPGENPSLEDFHIPSRKIWTKHGVAWEGDGMRSGDNIRTDTLYEQEEVLVPAPGWEKSVQKYLVACANFASNHKMVEADLEKVKERMEKSPSLGDLEKAAANRENAVWQHEVFTTQDLGWLKTPQAAQNLYVRRMENWARANTQFLLTHLEEKEGGLVRLVNNCPMIPVVRGEEPQEILLVQNEDGSWGDPWDMLSNWDAVDSWREMYY